MGFECLLADPQVVPSAPIDRNGPSQEARVVCSDEIHVQERPTLVTEDAQAKAFVAARKVAHLRQCTLRGDPRAVS